MPADLVLLRTSDSSGTCFIRTDQLDGETDWKLRAAVPTCQKLPSDRDLLVLDAKIYGTSALDLSDKVFNAKLCVTCAFHTPFMEAQENVFKDFVKGTLTATRELVAKVMSTIDGKWLERDLDVQYCWDNIRQPVLFGTALNKIVQELSAENVSFLEIAPHPVLKS